jgi:2-polyprenyl-3-methyl-5-hydroxy-6-metoxy-1,4-benzoquinol methylase
MRLKQFPTIEHRHALDQSDGRLEHWLSIVDRYGLPSGRVIEAGCAHGSFLAEMQKRGYECVGVEVDEATAMWAREHMGLDVRAGLFPDVELPSCDLFAAFDVLEHSPKPIEFMRGVAELLRPGGIAIIQTPVEHYEVEPPFGKNFRQTFDDVEHLFLFSETGISRLADMADLTIVAEEQWRISHEITIFKKLPSSELTNG